ncbi:hypothetical protein KR067_004230, partial [Drosophila pandora]
MYLAAKRIQAHWRRYRVQKLLRQRLQAVITIQRWWRGFWERSQQWRYIELQLQETVLAHFNRASNTIQALFRGWRDRRNVHDARKLHQMQTDAVEELLHSMALQMHSMKAEGFIAGVESLRDSSVLIKVDRLIAMLAFRYHNVRVVSLVSRRMTYAEEERRHFKNSEFFFEVPFAGPNFDDVCDGGRTKDKKLVKADIDQRFQDIVVGYENFQQNTKLKELLRGKELIKRQRLRDHIVEKEQLKNREFCEDVVDHMKKWQIWQDVEPFEFTPEIFCDENNFDGFFSRVRYLLDKYNVS